MKIAIIGANGQLGADLVKAASKESGLGVLPLTHKDFDVKNTSEMFKVLRRADPDVIVNTAAYHKVDVVEDNPEEAFLVNSVAVKNLAEFCTSLDKLFVFISTDYVFGGDKVRKKPYREIDVPFPVNVYGVSKVAGEHFTAMCPAHYVIRTSGLFGAAGSSGKGGNFVETMLRLASERDEIGVVNDQKLSPTYTADLSRQIVRVLKNKPPCGLYHIVSSGSCTWFEFAIEIFRQTKTKVRCLPILSYEYPTRADRPRYSVLSNGKLNGFRIGRMRPWQESLRSYLKEKKHI